MGGVSLVVAQAHTITESINAMRALVRVVMELSSLGGYLLFIGYRKWGEKQGEIVERWPPLLDWNDYTLSLCFEEN
jgi:hypothetical protein